jgi:serine/threonine protein kinase
MKPTTERPGAAPGAPETAGGGRPRPDDPRVLEAVEEYLAAQRAGRRPDRAAFLARHAEVAAALAECLDGLDFIQGAAPRLHDVAGGSSAGATGGPAPAPVEGVLGDFRLLRQVGRGGMGVVYEARQISLGRRVALKVLPFAAALDERQLRRFKNEAQAAAQLQHPHIVPVHAVGCERGVYYYAMQFIDGRTLAELITDLRQQARQGADTEAVARGPGRAGAQGSPAGSSTGPCLPPASSSQAPPGPAVPPYVPPYAPLGPAAGAPPADGAPRTTAALVTECATGIAAFFRTAARLGVQAAEALEHAHGQDIIHRDVKPGNLMVDGRGRLWVTDFGLAHVRGQASLTMSGDLLGTLRYMSPEQALAGRVPIDHRADIYSLGATLYELLTLEPAFPGKDRQELLRQVAFEEPRPPRKSNRAIPAELETVVLKAMAKSPADRYATAQELADDLRRFLDDRPILARPPTLAQRARKLARRHPGVTVTAALFTVALLALAVVGLTINNVLLDRERAQALAHLRRAEGAENRARSAEREARANLEKAQRAEQEKTEKLWQARLAQAQAGRWSGRAGRRFEGMEALREAAQIAPALGVGEEDLLKLRNEVIACMALPDLRPRPEFDKYGYDALSGEGTRGALDILRQRYAASDGKGTITIRGIRDDREITRLEGTGTRPSFMGFSPDGRFLSAIYPLDPEAKRARLFIWDLGRREIALRLPVRRGDSHPQWSPDGRRFAVYQISAPRTIALYDVNSHKEIQRFRAGNPEVAFDPSGKQLAVLGIDGAVQIRAVKTGRPVDQFAFPVPVARFAWGADGRFLAARCPESAAERECIYMWDVPARRVHTVLKGHTNLVIDARFNHAGDLLASTSWDGTVRLWNPWTGKELLRAEEGVWGQYLEFSLMTGSYRLQEVGGAGR